jgi:hypothetical protein
MDTAGSFPESEALKTPPSSAEVRNGGAIALLSHMSSWRGAQLNKHREGGGVTHFIEN